MERRSASSLVRLARPRGIVRPSRPGLLVPPGRRGAPVSVRPAPRRGGRSTEPHGSASGLLVSPPLQSSFIRPPASPFSEKGSTCRVFRPLRDVIGGVHSCGSFHPPDRVPPSGFLDLSTACSVSDSTGLFHPAAACRVCVQGLLPICSHPGSSPGACLLAVVALPLTDRSRLPRPGASTSRLRSTDRCVRANQVVHEIRGRFPRRVSSVGLPQREASGEALFDRGPFPDRQTGEALCSARAKRTDADNRVISSLALRCACSNCTERALDARRSRQASIG
jgi:hypothetical protein